MENEKRENASTEEILDSIAGGINIYWEYILEGRKHGVWQIPYNGSSQPNSETNREVFSYSREAGEAFYVGCTRYLADNLFGSQLVMQPKEEIGFMVIPDLFSQGKVKLRRTNIETGTVVERDLFMINLEKMDVDAMATLERAQINMLSYLVGLCKGRDLFDPMVAEVKELLAYAFGPEKAEELWRTGMEKL